MSLIRHIRQCNVYRTDRFLPFLHNGEQIGLIRRDNAERLKPFRHVFRVDESGVTFLAAGGFEQDSAAIDAVVERFVADGVIPKWRNEFFAVAPRYGAKPHFRLDRGAVPFFGTRAYGVHLNGIVRDGERLLMWIGRRAPDKKVAPSKLDNIVAGGIAWSDGIERTLVKEAHEEASIPKDVIARARPVGAVSYRMETELGVRDDVLFLHDVELPADFRPACNDGEIAEFMRLPAADVVEIVRAGDEFKFNVNLVIIDFALRHGLIGPNEPDYLDIATSLHRPLA
jgi:8-oxo-dGTP pyrophosphatase MutT (NUDIX family)